MLTGVQTTHATDRVIAGLVAHNAGPVASLVKWSRAGMPVLRVNATGILAKLGSASVDNEAITALQERQRRWPLTQKHLPAQQPAYRGQ